VKAYHWWSAPYYWVMGKLSTRRCPGEDRCEEAGDDWHTHHLTWLGRRRYT